ncbi:hypothetical protein NSPZN2_100511 [Nitrospira defluvii]|uniref:Uncharacterized protein n=1 Tax=Nitrospira defluvii TaxID=330214 RepID=A0ABN7LAG9_9BACT|nr:hypothetical protein NSPZN2_100511 [Nitrospira defluvii]
MCIFNNLQSLYLNLYYSGDDTLLWFVSLLISVN